MRSKGKRHPNFKAYLSQQLRVLQVKFPFLSSQQLKAKINASWDSFSPETKDEWRTPDKRSKRNSYNGKKDDSLNVNIGSEEICSDQHSPSYDSQENNNSYRKNLKKVRFMEPILTVDDASDVQSGTTDSTMQYWPGYDGYFNSIVAHKLDIEQGLPEEDSVGMDDQENDWPLFGDYSLVLQHSVIESAKKVDGKLEEQEESEGDLMCDLFEDIKRAQRRLLTCVNTSNENNGMTRMFEENDDKIFA